MTLVLGIGSWDRSGSTILARVLGTDPGAVSVGEINNLWERGVVSDMQCGCGANFSTCDFWSQVMAHAFDDHEDLLESAVRFSKNANNSMMATKLLRRKQHGIDDYVLALSRLYTSIASVSGTKLIVDSSKTPWHLEAAAVAADEFKLVHLVRDPRGVVYSHKKVMQYEPEADSGYMNQKGVSFTTAGWIYRNLILSGVWRSRRDRIVVTYEQFTARPLAISTQILMFAGQLNPMLPFDTENSIMLGVEHSVSGNPVRFRTGRVAIELDDEWKTGLDRDTRYLVGGATAPLRASYRRAATFSSTREGGR